MADQVNPYPNKHNKKQKKEIPITHEELNQLYQYSIRRDLREDRPLKREEIKRAIAQENVAYFQTVKNAAGVEVRDINSRNAIILKYLLAPTVIDPPVESVHATQMPCGKRVTQNVTTSTNTLKLSASSWMS